MFMTIRQMVLGKREQIFAVAQSHGARNIRLFGSVARDEADDQSDVDFLVELEPGRNLFDLGGLQMALQELLGRNVDVTTPTAIQPRLREHISREAMSL